jgi:allantoinase
MTFDAYYHNGLIVTESGQFEGGIAIHDGRVAGVFSGTNLREVTAKRTVDVNGRIIFPGVVDAHVHFSEIGRDFEGYEAGSKAAAAGGVTAVLEMPLNDLPPTTSRDQLRSKRETVASLSVVDYAHWGGLTQNNLAELPLMHADGAVGFKAFMKSIADFPRIDDDALYAGLVASRDLGTVIGVHAENEHVLNYLSRRLQEAGRTDRPAWLEAHTKDVELEAIQRAVFWAKATGGTLLVLHISIADAVRLIARAKIEGVRVFAETCAHYLFFDATDHLDIGPYTKASPPIRPRSEVEALWECVLMGHVDTIASEHSPFPASRHEQGLTSVWEGGGITGIQTILPAMITEGIHKRKMDWALLARLMSANPARIFDLYPRKGTLAPGSDADFVIIDPDKEWRLEKRDLLSRHQHSPYVGRTYRGRVDETVVRGTTVYRDGRIVVRPGYGQLLLRANTLCGS